MKKQSFWLRACIILIASAALYLPAHSQKTKLPKLTAAEEKEWNSIETEENALLSLSAADKAEGKEKGQAAVAYLLKALLHKADPATYPIDDKAGSPEKKALDAIDHFSAATLAKAKTKVIALMSDEPKRSLMLGKFKSIDFKKKSITPDMLKIGNLKFKPVIRATDQGTSLEQESSFIKPIGLGGAYVDEGNPAPTRLDMLIKRVRCMDETDPESPGDDDMIIGGLLVGASGNTKAANTLVSCHFDDGDVCNHGVFPFGSYSLQTTSSYPKVMYCILQLVEVDTDEAEAAQMLSDVMRSVAGAVSGFNAAIGAVVAAVAEAVDRFGSWFFGDDPFPPYGIVRPINSANAFGSDGVCPDKITNNIYGHDGAYKIRYFWIMH